jgi:hypothetical protein
MKVFNDGLKVANTLLPYLKPFADAAATALDGLLRHLGKFAGSKDFQAWLKQFQKLEGPSLTAIGKGLGQVGVALGKLLTTMSAKDVVNSINIAFTVLADTIDGLSFVLRRVMFNFDKDKRFFAVFGHDIAAVFGRLRHDIADWAHNVASYFGEARANIARWAADVGRDAGRVVSFFRALPGRIVSALGNLGHLLISAGAALIRGLITGIEGAIPGLTSVLGWVHSLLGGGGAPGGGSPRPGTPGGPGGFRGGGAMAPVMASVSAVAGGAMIAPHRAPYYGPRRITNQFIPAAGHPGPPHVIVRFEGGESEFAKAMAAILSRYARVSHGGSAQAAYGYGPG